MQRKATDRKFSFVSTPYILITTLLLVISFASLAQEKKRIEILQAGELVQSEAIAGAQRLLDDVIIKHREILMYCDSAYTYEGSNRVDAFGKVHINQGDTLHLYARKIYYDGDINFARAIKDVKLVNSNTTLFTDTLDYDMNLNIGYYDCTGKIVDSTNILTSDTGRYYLDEDIVHFIKNVVGYNDNYTIYSDNIRYNTTSEVIYFDGPTTIQDSTNTLYAEDGWYNTITGEADLQLAPKVYNDVQYMEANQIKYNQENGDGIAVGNVHIEDYENRTIVQGNRATYNELTEKAVITDSAMFISYNETDSLFLHADTLKTQPDTIEGENLVIAYYGVRFFRTDVQGICDSLMYFTKDSVVQLHFNPVIWSEGHQLSANYIEMKQKTDAPDEMHMTDNSFIISKQDSSRYDQIKGKNMTGYIINGQLNNIDVDGNGQTLYYARDEEAIIGLNQAESSNIGIHFNEGKIHKIAFLKQPEGNLKPLSELTDADKTLSGFEWKIHLRPLTKNDIFWKPKETNISTKEDAGLMEQN